MFYSRAQARAMETAASAAGLLAPIHPAASQAANALSDDRPTRLSDYLRICYPYLTAKTGHYGAGTTAETQLVEIKAGVKDPQIIGAIAGIYNLLEGFDTDMIGDRSFIPTIKKYRRLRVAGILQAMVLGEVELSDQSVYTASMIARPCLGSQSSTAMEMTLSTAVSPALVPRKGRELVVRSRKGREQECHSCHGGGCREGDLPPNVQPAGAEEAFKAWAYQRPTAL